MLCRVIVVNIEVTGFGEIDPIFVHCDGGILFATCIYNKTILPFLTALPSLTPVTGLKVAWFSEISSSLFLVQTVSLQPY